MDIESGIVRIGFVEQEKLGIRRRAVNPVDEASRLGGAHRASLLRQQRGERIALAFRCTYPCDNGQYIEHRLEIIRDVGTLKGDRP